MSTVTELKLSIIRLDGGTQPRAELTQEVIKEYAEAMKAGVMFPPVAVFYDGTSYWLADGFHRVEATLKIGASTITANLRPGTLREAVLYSVGVNAAHGLRRSNEDKRRAVATLLHDPEWSLWSDREIARHAGVSDRFVNNLSKELTANGSQSNCRRGADGRIINTTNIGKRTSLVGRNQSKSSPEETEAWPGEGVSFPRSISLDSQRQLTSTLTIDVTAEVIEDDEEFSVPTEIFPASTPLPQPELLIKLPDELESPEATSSKLSPELEQAEESLSEQEANTLLDLEVGDHVHIEGRQNRYYNGKTASIVQVTSRHKTLTAPVEDSSPRNTVSLPIQHCTKVDAQAEAPALFQFEVGVASASCAVNTVKRTGLAKQLESGR